MRQPQHRVAEHYVALCSSSQPKQPLPKTIAGLIVVGIRPEQRCDSGARHGAFQRKHRQKRCIASLQRVLFGIGVLKTRRTKKPDA